MINKVVGLICCSATDCSVCVLGLILFAMAFS